MNTAQLTKLCPHQQAIYNVVSVHLLAQNAKSTSADADMTGYPACLYRSPDGCRCAVGILVADEHYTSRLECKNIKEEVVKKAVELSIGRSLLETELHMLSNVQLLHDHWPVEDWRRRLERIAQEYSLDFAAVFMTQDQAKDRMAEWQKL